MCIVHINSSVWYSVFVVVHIHVHFLFVLCVLSVMFFNSSWYVKYFWYDDDDDDEIVYRSMGLRKQGTK